MEVTDRSSNTLDNKRIILVTHRYPAGRTTDGQRARRFAENLAELGWEPIIVSPLQSCLPEIPEEEFAAIPEDLKVFRSPCLDPVRHLDNVRAHARGPWLALSARVLSKFCNCLAFPDSMILWAVGLQPLLIRLIRQFGVKAVWVTSPRPSALLAAILAKRRTGVRAILDYRDPWSLAVYNWTPGQRALHRRLERWILAQADAVCAVTEGMARSLEEAFALGERLHVVPNGYIESDFDGLEPCSDQNARIELIHGGNLVGYRSLVPIIRAMKQLIDTAAIGQDALRLVNYGSAPSREAQCVQELGLADSVDLRSRISRRELLARMAAARGLILIVPDQYRTQVPAKLFEYMRLGRPILLIAPADCETRRMARDYPLLYWADCDNIDEISKMLGQVVDGTELTPEQVVRAREFASRFEARKLTERLVSVLNSAV